MEERTRVLPRRKRAVPIRGWWRGG